MTVFETQWFYMEPGGDPLTFPNGTDKLVFTNSNAFPVTPEIYDCHGFPIPTYATTTGSDGVVFSGLYKQGSECNLILTNVSSEAVGYYNYPVEASSTPQALLASQMSLIASGLIVVLVAWFVYKMFR